MKEFLKFLEKRKLTEYMVQGVEKECLRVDSESKVATSLHPQGLGSKLTHPFITTDYSENLLEFITQPHTDVKHLYQELLEIHQFAYSQLGDEIMWPNSMPAILPKEDKDIQVAYYGENHVGKMKEVYRVGLGHRYGKKMQSIAGIHFNFSFSNNFWSNYLDFFNRTDLQAAKDEAYLKLIRNYKRSQWLLVYLFSASPLAHTSFAPAKRDTYLHANDFFTQKKATSLRMSRIGYTSAVQDEIRVCYNSLETYIKTLENYRTRPAKAYEAIGLKDDEGNYKQLNTCYLQIANEFYSTIRPKNVTLTQEGALQALSRRGIEYIEVRILDLNPFDKVGISERQMMFLQLYLASCFFTPSKEMDKEEYKLCVDKLSKTVYEGRSLNEEQLQEGLSIFKEMEALLNYFPAEYRAVFEKEKEKLLHPEKCFSERTRNICEDGFLSAMQKLAAKHKEEIENAPKTNELDLQNISLQSNQDFLALEANKEENFDKFLEHYFESIKISEINA